MSVIYVTILTDGLREYYKDSELFELFELFDVDVPLELESDRPAYMGISRNLLTMPEHGNNRRLLEALVPSLVSNPFLFSFKPEIEIPLKKAINSFKQKIDTEHVSPGDSQGRADFGTCRHIEN